MIKMMVIVVIVFTACWLPFNTLVVVWDNDESMGEWSGMPYLWFAFHWLAMSHSCYNPVIYCWMNARFRAGFCIVLEHVPCLRGILPARHRSSNTSSVTGIALTGMDAGTESSILHRVNTCTTYISMRRKNPHHVGNNCSSTSPARSASVFRHQAAGAHHNGHRKLSRLDSNPLEDQI